MPHFEKDNVDTGFGFIAPKAAIAVNSFSASVGTGTMSVTYDTYASAEAMDPANPADPIPGKTFTNTVPLGEDAVRLLTMLLGIIAKAAASETPPAGLDGVKFVP